jgi:hypothetical protein
MSPDASTRLIIAPSSTFQRRSSHRESHRVSWDNTHRSNLAKPRVYVPARRSEQGSLQAYRATSQKFSSVIISGMRSTDPRLDQFNLKLIDSAFIARFNIDPRARKFDTIPGNDLFPFLRLNLPIHHYQTIHNGVFRLASALDETFQLQYLVELDREVLDPHRSGDRLILFNFSIHSPKACDLIFRAERFRSGTFHRDSNPETAAGRPAANGRIDYQSSDYANN